MEKKLTPAREAMIEALRQAMAGNRAKAKKAIKKAKVELNKQYS
jgi:cellobiose-specific phosphotransferase system component IIA